jgi:hypothetical protein
MKTTFLFKHRNKLLFFGIFISMIFFIPYIGNTQSLLYAPQKIVIDAKRNRLLVSNDTITGKIVQIDSLGVQSYFHQYGGYIDGMEIVGDTIFGVGKNRKIIAYNLVTKDTVFVDTIPGLPGNYLSSITSDSAGHLFISCPKTNEIYKMRISDRSYWTFAKGNGLLKPNGILLEKEKNRIVVISDSASSNIYAISLTDSTVSTLISTSLYSPDGIVRDKYGVYYIGGYYLSGIYRIDSLFANPPEMIFPGNHMVYPTYDASNHSLLITYYGANSWARIDIASIGINEEKENPGLTNFSCYPNPFVNFTTIKFYILQKAKIQMEVFDATGKLMVVLMNEEKLPGNYEVKWNGKDSAQNRLPEGTYYVTLSLNRMMQTQKVILKNKD